MTMLRWLSFLVVILIGFALGLFYTWRINPIDYTESDPDTLRIDFKTDYVLMVAEVYTQERDIGNAVRRLTHLTLSPSDVIVSEAVQQAERFGYNNYDLVVMKLLLFDLRQASSGSEYPPP